MQHQLGWLTWKRVYYLPHHTTIPAPTRTSRIQYNNVYIALHQHISLKHNSPIHVFFLQGESLARCPKIFSIKNYVIEIMTWKFIYTYRERSKTGPAHNRCCNWSPFTPKHTGMRLFKFWNTFPKVSKLTAWISWRIVSLSCSIVLGCIFVHFALQ